MARKHVSFILHWVKHCRAAGLIMLAALLLPLPAPEAHPHVFIVQRLTLVFDAEGLGGIKVWWKFDDMFASMIAEDHDTNRDGRLEAEEVQSVKENAFAFIITYNYFTFIRIDGRPFDVKFVKDFNAVLEDNRLVYEFFIPCHVTAITAPKKLAIVTYDPNYYSAIYFTQKAPVSLSAADAYEVKTEVREDPDTSIYYDMVHPWALFLEFRKRV
jgi:ABC-type uncharacterized transport system substrate-binding protein